MVSGELFLRTDQFIKRNAQSSGEFNECFKFRIFNTASFNFNKGIVRNAGLSCQPFLGPAFFVSEFFEIL